MLGKAWKDVGPYIDLGMRLALTVFLGLFLGYELDKKIGSLPLFTIVGSILGMIGGMMSVYQSVYGRKDKDDETKV
ncbi:MAG TPA: AtpZ/AtpI family protein [Bacteroidetes bacterium]|nr:AtpZ/AtpI family protein [Bacteroidota bacterium]